MKRIMICAMAVFLILSLTACSEVSTEGATSSSVVPTSAAEELTSSASTDTTANEPSKSKMPENNSGEESNILVAVFSLAGEQYEVNVIEEGNTEIIAKMIAEQTDADLFDITPVSSYPETYDGLLEISRQEMSENARPEIANIVEDIDKYDTIFVGYPIWWGDMPMIVYNFLESYNFSGKTLVPFCTHGGSGLSGTANTIAEITGATILDGLAVRGETAQNQRDEAQSNVIEWLRAGGFVD